ncbi:MAG: hypothetical protein QOE82_3896 [Thermoanaerobaculia bacterium]|jgi:hypothetical protein|nr:hypothetical protein [Thermoanaerobaculia bacterium]
MSRSLLCGLVLLFVAIAAFPQSRREGVRSGPGTGDPYESLVPWHFLEKGGALVNAPLVLYWLPATSQETERSPLLTSPELVRATDRCLGFEIVLPEDAKTIERFSETGKLPAALLADAKGTVIRRVEGSRGRVEAPAVEKMVRDELSARGESMYATMSEARKRVKSGDMQGAIDLYTKLWNDRCLFPLAGTEAQHALKELGVIVVEPPAQIAVDPNLTVKPAKPKQQ